MQVKDILRATQREAAAALGVNSRTLRGWHDSGAPRNGDQTYSIPALVAWRIEIAEAKADESGNGDSPELEKWRRARRKLAELELSTRRAEMIPAAAVKRDVGTIVEHFKAKLLGLPNKCAAALASFDKPEDCFDELTREMYELLDDLRAGFLKLIADGDLGGPVERDGDADS